MPTIRPLRLPADMPALARLDTGFSTDRIYRLDVGIATVALVEVPVDPPLQKTFPADEWVADLATMDAAFGAEVAGELVGVVGVTIEGWNRRALVWHLYVARTARGQGIGRALLDAAHTFATEHAARSVWVETQTINMPAIGFYRAAGFRWCGFDDSLYDPATMRAGEVALFFARDLP